MAVVSTPPSLSSVVATFGGPGNLTAYTRGGSYVPNVAMNNAVATVAGSLALSQFAGATTFSASASPISSSKTVPTPTSTGTSNTFTCSVVGGTSVTYTWTKVSGTGTINSPTSATTTITDSPHGSGDSLTYMYCIAKDVNGTTTNTGQVSFDVVSAT